MITLLINIFSSLLSSKVSKELLIELLLKKALTISRMLSFICWLEIFLFLNMQQQMAYKSDWHLWFLKPRVNGIMDSALPCCTGGPGLIPAVHNRSMLYSNVFFSRHKVMGIKRARHNYLRDLVNLYVVSNKNIF